MEKKYTPGPWTWDVWQNLDPVFALDMVQGYGTIYWTEESKREANARLIAAAPDLLEALEALLDEYVSQMKSEYDFPGDPWTPDGRNDKVALRVIATIAKAKGEA